MDYQALGEALRSGDASVLSGPSLATLHVGLQLDAFSAEHVPVVARVVQASGTAIMSTTRQLSVAR